jgi:UDP-N-acetylmuramyl pentapeptide phosphotransferase/UDP-N-acetylglucosamine-1-phosphate transferase
MPVQLLATASAAFVASCLGTRLLVTLLRRGAVLDHPNERSSHIVPVPRGGGIAVVATIIAAWITLYATGTAPQSSLWIALAAIGLAAISWIDDLRRLSPAPRLLAQIAAVVAGIWLALGGAVFQGWLPPWLDIAATAIVWVWFINLFNFMDGIDGIAGSETAAIGIGLVLLASVGSDGDPGIAVPAAAVAAAALGFLIWNWAPSRIILGDVGSVPLGYILGYLLCELAVRGRWQAALILPLYFLADASLTLLRRLVRGERIWQAHREHFYQRAVQRGLGHDAVVLRVIAANIVLIGCAWAAEEGVGAGRARCGGADRRVAARGAWPEAEFGLSAIRLKPPRRRPIPRSPRL